MERAGEVERLRMLADRVPLDMESAIIRTRVRQLDHSIQALNDHISQFAPEYVFVKFRRMRAC